MIDLRFRPIDKPIKPPDRYQARRWDLDWTGILDNLEREFRHLKASNIVVEAALSLDKIRNDGWPYSHATPASPGIRITFHAGARGNKEGGAELVFECATFRDWQQNMHAIGLTLQRLRLVDEYGATSGQQYRGFAALPPGGGIVAAEWPSVEAAAIFLLEVAGYPTVPSVRPYLGGALLQTVYRDAARKAHPDTNDNNGERMAKVNRAKDYIEKHGARVA